MVQMPSSNELGARLPRAARGQPNYPSSSPIAGAIERAGATIAKAGFSLAAQQNQENDKTIALGVQSRLLQFEDQWMTDAVNRVQNAQPGAAGFADTFAKDYQAAARKFFTSVPDELKPVYDQKLFEIESRLLGKARTFEREESDRYAKTQVEDGQNVLLNRQAADPDQWKSVEQEGEALIRSRPGISHIEADEEARAWRQRRALQLFETRRARDEAGERGRLGVAGLPAGMRNNNPGNIKYVGQGRDRGVTGPSENTDQGDPQAVFATPEEGMREAYSLARRKYDGGKTTANQLIAGEGGWTPGNTKAAANIAGSMGLGPDDDLQLNDPVRAQKFLRALVTQEHGAASRAYSDQMISAAVSGTAPARNDLPVIVGNARAQGRISDPDIKGVDPVALDLFRRTQNAFGQSIPIVSGFRDPDRNRRAGGAKSSQHMNGRALDLDVSKLSQAERLRLIETASAQGFTGIGVYANSIHLDTGGRRAWGPSHGRSSVPDWAEGAIAAHLAGKTAPAGGSKGGVDYTVLSDPAPEYAALSFEDRLKMFEQSLADEKRKSAERAAQDRFDIGVAETNAPVAFSQSGAYTGQMPSIEKYISAYGEQEGVQRYQQFEASVETSRKVFDMRAAPASEIDQMVADAQPISNGPTAALEQKRYEALSSAREAIFKAREADPAGYVIQTFPAIGAAFDQAFETKDYAPAVRMSMEAQQRLGVQNIQPMPKKAAETAVATFKDDTIPEMDRIAAISSPITAVANGEGASDMQRAIFDQMVAAGLPEVTEGAMEALARGDEAAATRLFRAAVVDVSKLPGEGPKPAEIDTVVQSRLLDEGQVGDLYYGLSDGSVENFERAQRDAKLLNNAINIRVRNGETLEAATDAAAKDLFGNVKVLTGDSRVNAQVLVPSDEEEEPVLEGFAGLMPQVEQSLRDNLVLPADAPTRDSTKPILNAAKETFVQNMMARGVWRNVEGGFAFIDPVTGTYVKGPDEKPRIFTMDDVMGNRLPPAPAFLPNDPTRTVDQNVQDEMRMQEEQVRKMYEGAQ